MIQHEDQLGRFYITLYEMINNIISHIEEDKRGKEKIKEDIKE